MLGSTALLHWAVHERSIVPIIVALLFGSRDKSKYQFGSLGPASIVCPSDAAAWTICGPEAAADWVQIDSICWMPYRVCLSTNVELASEHSCAAFALNMTRLNDHAYPHDCNEAVTRCQWSAEPLRRLHLLMRASLQLLAVKDHVNCLWSSAVRRVKDLGSRDRGNAKLSR